MLHNIVQAKKIPIPIDNLDELDKRYPQPTMYSITNNTSVPGAQSYSGGEPLRNILLEITNKLPLRKQIVLKK